MKTNEVNPDSNAPSKKPLSYGFKEIEELTPEEKAELLDWWFSVFSC